MPVRYIMRLRANQTGVAVGVNDFENVFAYEDVAGDGSALDLNESFIADKLPALVAITSVGVTYNQISTFALEDPTDFALSSFSTPGTRSGEYLPMFTGWEFQYVRQSRAVANGRKTFAGIAEQDQANGAPIAGLSTAIAAVETALRTDVVGAGSTYVPRIWRRAGDYGDPPVAFVDTFYPISTVVFRRISTQNTRKR